MCCLKMARGTSGTPNLDDAIDLAGYAGLWGECYSNQLTTPKDENIVLVRHEWRSTSGASPVDIENVIEVELRDGNCITPDRIWRWKTTGEQDDVVAVYRRAS